MQVEIIQNRIYEIRGQRVMLDFDLAELYEVETKRLNEQMRRNIDRFPEDFMFRLSEGEWIVMRSQIATASDRFRDSNSVDLTEKEGNRSQIATGSQKHRGGTPFAFTEHGVTMLASVLRSKRAVDMNIAIVRAFIAIKKAITNATNLHEQMNELRLEMRERIGEHDTQLKSIYDALENLLDKSIDKDAAKKEWVERERIGFKK